MFLASDWNKFQEITANLQKFITIDLVNYINSTYFTMEDVRNEIDLKINIFKTGELIKIIKDEVKKMGNFYTYIRPSETEYITFPDINITNEFESGNGYVHYNSDIIPIMNNIYDINLFGYGYLTATVRVSSHVIFSLPFSEDSAELQSGFNYPTIKVLECYDGYEESDNIECPPRIDIFTKNKLGFVTGDFPNTVPIKLNSTNRSILCNASYTVEIGELVRFCNAHKTNLGIKLSNTTGTGSINGHAIKTEYKFDVSITNIKLYREKFIPPINQLGDL